MTLSPKHGLLAAALLIALHVGLGLLPEPPFTVAMNLVLCTTNLYVLYCATAILRGRPPTTLAVFLIGYLALWLLLMVVLDKQPLFILLVVAYASVFGSPFLLGFFVIFVLCFVIFQPYAFATFIPLALVYVVVWRARTTTSRFTVVCLALGLLGLAVVLFPIIQLTLQDSAHTLWQTLTRTDVRDAIVLSLLSSTVATVLVMIWGIPLAYALARLDFRGKQTIEALIDVPILVPQSVAGIALIALLGRGSPVGEWLDSLGIGVSGTMAALVVAQVFVAAPFLIKTAMTAFEGVPSTLELASRSLGCSGARTFWRISLPLAARGILVGAALAWARAISEFGTVILFASSPVSAPIMVHNEFLRAGTSESRPIAIVLLITCLWFFFILRFAQTLLPFTGTRREAAR